MSHDVVIRGGTIVDGTGGPPRRGDVAIDGDRIVGVGDVGASAHREIDADGRFVTPGFVDVHTHLDAQISWDPIASSSCWHGVTSIVIGNCGVTFAPCRPGDREYLAEMMESVEDIPRESIMSGLDWNWETYGEYLDAVDAFPKGINVGGMVGHCALRYHAMGERSLDSADPSDAELAQMCDLVDEAMDAGALGFSSSRTLLHIVPDGRQVPGTFADIDELAPIAEVLGRRGRGVFETAAMIGEQNNAGPDESRREIALFGEISRRSARPITFGLTHTYGAGDLYQKVLGYVADENSRGAHLRPQTTVRSVGVLFNIGARTPFDRCPSWRALRDVPLAEKLTMLRDGETRERLVGEAGAPDVPADPSRIFVMDSEPARYEYDAADSLAAHAERRGVSAAEAMIDISLETGGRAIFNLPFLNQSFDAVRDMLGDESILMGLADAGAHVGQIMDASQATFFLSHWVRDKAFCTIEEGVRRLTSDTAALFGISDRGVLAPGAYADINIFDLDALALPLPRFEHDFPGGAGRYVQGGRGYDYTIVNGEIFMQNGEHAGALSGRVLRGQ